MLESFLWVGVVATAMVLLFGAIAMRSTLGRVDALSETLERVGKGELSARVPIRNRGDDFDRIGHGVNEMLERIDTLVGDVKRVSTNIAHDLRTPLAHVRHRLEAAAARSDPASIEEDARAAAGEVEEVLRIFDAMLRLSEIEAGAAKARFGAVDLCDLVERVTDAYRPDIEAAGHKLDVSSDQGVFAQGDGALIAQALANLLENAMRYSGDETTIRVRLQRDGDTCQAGSRGFGRGYLQSTATGCYCLSSGSTAAVLHLAPAWASVSSMLSRVSTTEACPGGRPSGPARGLGLARNARLGHGQALDLGPRPCALPYPNAA